MAAIRSHSSRLGQQWGSMCACVQETKTLHAQHKQNILRYTCVFPKKLTVNIYSKHSQQFCKWHGNPILSQLEILIRPMDGLEMWLEVLVVNYLQVHDFMLVYYTGCYKHELQSVVGCHLLVVGTSFTSLIIQKWSPQQHCTIVCTHHNTSASNHAGFFR